MTSKRRGPISRLIRPVAAALASLLLTSADAETFEVELWANDESVEALPNVVSTGSHPCGAIAIVRVSAMPPYRRDEGALGTELVAEADADGREIARWSVPVGYQPLAVMGPEILLDLSRRRLWFGTDGAIRRERVRRDYPPIVAMECPAGGAHPDSVYAQCATLLDLADRRSRFIQYEAPCT